MFSKCPNFSHEEEGTGDLQLLRSRTHRHAMPWLSALQIAFINLTNSSDSG